MKIKVLILAMVALMSLVAVVPAFALGNAVEFDHEGKDKQCSATNPHNVAGPNPAFGALHLLWHSECDHIGGDVHTGEALPSPELDPPPGR